MIEVKNLTKKYGDHIAVDNLTFTVEDGRIYGFLGPNGAGKSTTMNIITGCLAATEGSVKINGHDIFEEPTAAKKSIGYLPELPPIYPDMTPYEYLTFVAEAKGVDKGEIEDQVEEVMKETQISNVSERLIKNLSKGYKQRVGIAQAMLGNPDVIILDEPTVGLDPKQIIEIRELIHSLGQNRTVILSSHILSEISAICDYIMIISNGKMVASDTIDKLSTDYTGKSTVLMTLKGPEGKIRMILNDIEEILEYELEDNEDGTCNVKITISRESDIREKLFFAFSGIALPILSMTVESLSLEDVFLQLTSAPDEEEYEEETENNDSEDDEDNDDNEEDEEDEEESDEDGDNYTSMFGGKRGDD